MNPDRSADNQNPESAADDSLVEQVFEALEVAGPAAGRLPPETALTDDGLDEPLEDSFRAEADESLIDAVDQDFDAFDDEAAALTPAANRGTLARGLRAFFGLVGGSLLAVAVALLVLMWGLGRDPFGVSIRLPERLAFLLPPAFREVADRAAIVDEDGMNAAGDAFGIRD